ncbi:hypothetical protein F4678DRAFT_87902 [Xylaria arbuscula]|nr:hypothetical protein F4678DRAFT_87902 [Xylaria arbuscula]
MTSKVLERALKKFRDGLTQQQRQQFNACSIDDVKAEIVNIQDRLGSMKKLRSLRRISQFLEAMAQIEQLVNVFLNASNVVAFVWGPIKLALLVATARVEYLECLLDTYVEVGEIIPNLQQYDKLFKAAPCVLEVLERYFCDILEFHQNALDVFARPAWTKFFDATWKTFRTRFKPILESLKRHKTLLHDLKLDAAVLEIQVGRSDTLNLVQRSSDQTVSQITDTRKNINDVYKKLSDQIYDVSNTLDEHRATQRAAVSLQQVNAIIDKLNPPHIEDDQYTALRSCHKQSGDWVFKDPTYLQWTKSTTSSESVLFIHGMPGAGKTLLASRIISHLRSLPGMTCLFFYFKQSDDTKSSMSHMLRSLLAQLTTIDASIVPELYQKCCVVGNSEARQLASLKAWTANLLKSQNSCMIILDGLDECNYTTSGNEARQILDWMTANIIPEAEKDGSRIRLLALGQRDGIVDSALSKYPSIQLDSIRAHLDDIFMFARSRASKIRERFELNLEEELAIIKRITTTAKGMFLYAKVVMDNLMAQGSLAELDEELNVSFPTGLNEAYERVVFRVLDNPARHHTHRDAAAKVLSWLTCAVRPLKWNEIQCLFCIDPYKGVSNSRNRRVDSCKSLCGSFVEVGEHSLDMPQISPVVSLVHETARRYLIQTRRVDLLEVNATMALFSSVYLASIPFHKNSNHNSILNNALTGYYGLQDYMISSWDDHMTISLKQAAELPAQTNKSLRTALLNLLSCCNFDVLGEDTFQSFDDMRVLLTEESLSYLVRQLEQLSSTIRKVTEDIDPSRLDTRTSSVFISLNGKQGYKCPKPKCFMFYQHFESKKARDAHLTQHRNQFVCAVDGCLRQTLGFASLLDLRKHEEQDHSSCTLDSDTFPVVKESRNILDAARNGDIDFMKSFQQAGGNLNSLPERGVTGAADTPLRISAQYGQLESCQYLVRRGCSIFHANNKVYPARSALGAAIETRNTKLIRQLLDLAGEEETREFINSPALAHHYAAAIDSGESEVIDAMTALLSRREEKLDFPDLFRAIAGYRQFKHADSSKVYEALSTMVERYNAWTDLSGQAALSPKGNYLHLAGLRKNPIVMAFLLRHVSPEELHVKNSKGATPVFTAIYSRNVECVQLLLNHGGERIMDDYDNENYRPLHKACLHHHWNSQCEKIIEALVPYSMRHLNDKDKEGKTPLHLLLDDKYVFRNGADSRLPSVQLLLDTGAIDLTIRNNSGNTVFDLTKDRATLSALYAASKKREHAFAPNEAHNTHRPLSLPPADPSATDLCVPKEKEKQHIGRDGPKNNPSTGMEEQEP